MAKDKKELEKELKNGSSSFTLIGTVHLTDDGFSGGKQKENSKWFGVNSSFGVEISEGNIVYPTIRGGYMLDSQVLKRFSKTAGEGMITIPYDKRHDEKLLDQIAPYAFKKGAIARDESGKPILKRFIDDIDYEEYLAGNLKEGMEVRVMGKVEYSEGKEDKVYRNYSVTGVYLNEEYTKNSEVVPPAKHSALIHQTYVFGEDAVDSAWKKEFKNDGQVTLTLNVPQYVGKRLVGSEYIEWKKVMPIKQVIYIKGDPEDEKSVKLTEALVQKLFTTKRGAVRELGVNCIINEGYDTQNGNFEISKEMQDLIDMGLISEEEVKNTVNVRGSRVSELIFASPMTKIGDSGEISISLEDDKYAEEALYVQDVDVDEDEDEVVEIKSKPEVDTDTDEAYGVTGSDQNGKLSSDAFDDLFAGI